MQDAPKRIWLSLAWARTFDTEDDRQNVVPYIRADLVPAMADRIEALEAALRRWESYGCPDCGGDCASANPPVACCIMRETFEALEGK